MKKLLLWLMVIILSLSIIGLFALSSCKATTAETTSAATTAAETKAAETTASSETQPVAAEEELYIFCQPGNGIEILQTYAWGGFMAEQYWNSIGANIKFEWTGPDDFDAEKFIAALEATIAKNPTGILIWPIGFGEDQLLTDYYNSGGLIAGMNGGKGNYPVDFLIGTDNELLGAKLAQGLVDSLGGKGEVGVMMNLSNDMSLRRYSGMKSVFDKNPDIIVIDPIADAETKDAATANAAAFLSAHPDVKGLIGTTTMDGAAWARALQEANIPAGQIKVVGIDKDADMLNLIDSGYVDFSISQNFPVESFYAISILHLMHANMVSISNDDKTALGRVIPGAEIVSTTLNKITKDTTKYYRDIKPPEGWSLTTGKF
ncbi:MAG: substrate-binding domain-containing protein [Actinobacteria bacterium]|nr:substrate-binding domain-containing protein [Actinomycetota bacterium]